MPWHQGSSNWCGSSGDRCSSRSFFLTGTSSEQVHGSSSGITSKTTSLGFFSDPVLFTTGSPEPNLFMMPARQGHVSFHLLVGWSEQICGDPHLSDAHGQRSR